jgi:hypothetical protein
MGKIRAIWESSLVWIFNSNRAITGLNTDLLSSLTFKHHPLRLCSLFKGSQIEANNLGSILDHQIFGIC